ncbi:3-hydroxyisobutyryl-CoA hydrolase 1-like [Pyrus ussuriensis x Pyrus communis]|uniref:3-hydroxyisobutyryl-CoA hydrolase n=1 Tax=Pyrus ussuriensis x Pyrus communis TaxID=2448454 RepID=A0A5N5EWB3_9ROSA|nr:3-hydroxyisobutyryl-CoA hydrolase 1-like [Pyrus ussuriensis x Pyrus communis]
MASSITSTPREGDSVLVQKNLIARTLTLNRPRQLNALNFDMISRLLEHFLAFEDDANVKLVIVKGKGRAFCAGGDVAAVVRQINEGNWRLAAHFFQKEYTLNYLLATYSKPQVSILDGIVMGGGAGASIHGRFRVATENSVFAMPETALGLFPDVGATYYLSRLPGFFGEYVGLTGTRLDGAEMLACGLATHFVPSTRLSLLEEALNKVDSSDFANIQAIIDKYSQSPALKKKSAYFRMDVIDKCFSRRTVEEILSALEDEEANNRADDWLTSTVQALKKASPMSLKISLRSIREGRLQGVGQCLVCEYRMVSHVVKGEVSKDFREGCRALLLDKDKNPKWEPSNLELVTNHMVEQYFSKLDDEGWEELKLPARSNLPATAIAKL